MGKQGSNRWGMSVVRPNVNAHLPTETGIPPAISWSTLLSSWHRCEKNPPFCRSFFSNAKFQFFFFQEFHMFFGMFTHRSLEITGFRTEHWPHGTDPGIRLQAKSAVPTARIASGMAAASRWGFRRKSPGIWWRSRRDVEDVEEKSDVFCVFFLGRLIHRIFSGKIHPPFEESSGNIYIYLYLFILIYINGTLGCKSASLDWLTGSGKSKHSLVSSASDGMDWMVLSKRMCPKPGGWVPSWKAFSHIGAPE